MSFKEITPRNINQKKNSFPFAPSPKPCTSGSSFHNCDNAVLPVLQTRLHSSTKSLLSSHTVLNLSWLKKSMDLLRQQQVSRAVNRSLYGCKVKQPSHKRKIKPLHLKNASGKFYIIFPLCYLTGLLFFLLASSLRIQECQLISDQDQEHANSLQLLPSPRCVTRSPLMQEELQQQHSGQLTGVSPYSRRAGAEWKEKHSYQCQPSHQGACAQQKGHV